MSNARAKMLNARAEVTNARSGRAKSWFRLTAVCLIDRFAVALSSSVKSGLISSIC